MTSCESLLEDCAASTGVKESEVGANLPKKVHFPIAGETVAFDTTRDLHFEGRGLQRHDWRWLGHVERTRHSLPVGRIPTLFVGSHPGNETFTCPEARVSWPSKDDQILRRVESPSSHK